MPTHERQVTELVCGIGFLLYQNRTGVPLLACPEEHQVIEQIFEFLAGNALRFDGHAPVGLEAKQVQTAECGSVLVLLSYGLLENVNLDMRSLFGQLARRNSLLLVEMQCMKEADRKAAGPAEARTGRHVRDSA